MIVHFFFCIIVMFCFNTHAEDDFFSDNTAIETQKIYYDPLQKFNRLSFKIMKLGNNFVILPLANIYDFSIPNFLHSHIRSFMQNTQEPINFLNSVFIPHKPNALHSLSRTLFNTAFGLFGFFDIHAQYNPPMARLSFDDISQYYAEKPLPYLVLPMGFGNIFIIANWFQTSLLFEYVENNGYRSEVATLTFSNIVTSVHANKDQIDDSLNNSIDPYSIMRNVYYQLQKGKLEKISRPTAYKKYIDIISEEFL